jgi:sporulation protein YlmC with PRC-barrel domain
MTHRTQRSVTALAAALSLAFAASVTAADNTTGSATNRTAAPAATTSAAPATSAKPSAAAGQTVRDIRMSQLVGMDVRNARGENLGDIKDLVIDADSGRVQYAVVGIGGFLGIGEKLSAFPMSAFKVSADARGGTAAGSGPMMDNDGVKGDRGPIGSDRTPAERAAQGKAGPIDNDGVKGDKGPIGSDRAGAAPATTGVARMGRGDMHAVLNADPQRLKRAPNFDADQWPDWNDAKYRSTVDRAAGVNAPAGKAGRLVRASELLDADIRDAKSADVGEIEDLVVDVRNGQIRYAVVEFDRAWSMDDKLVAVPMTSLKSSGDKGELRFAGDRAQIKNAPAFEKSSWPDLNEGRYRSDMDRYLSSWGTGATPGSGMTSAPTDRSRGTTASGSPGTGAAGMPTR